MLWVELSFYKKKPWELWIFSLETLVQVHYSDPTTFWNLKTKYLQIRLFLTISHLITFFLQSLKTGSASALMFTITTQYHLLLRYLRKPSCRTDSYVKNPMTLGAINSWNKTQHQFSNLSLKEIVKWSEPCKCVILLVSRTVWHKGINPSLKEWRFWHLILTSHFLP